MIDNIDHLGGIIQGTENGSTDGWVVYLNFLYTGDVSNLRHVITQLAINNTEYWIRIESNTGWFSQVSQYYFTVAIGDPKNLDKVRGVLLQQHLLIFDQETESFLEWKNSTVIHGSSAAIDKTWSELREGCIQLISNEANMTYWTDFWVSY